MITTCTVQKKAKTATIKSPVRKAPSVPPPSSLVASADTSTAGHTSGLGDLPLQHKTMSGVMTT